MSIFYPTPSLCSPLPPHTSHPPTPPTPLPTNNNSSPPRVHLKKVYYSPLCPDLRNKCVPSGFDGSLPPLVYLEVQPSSYVDGVLVVELEGLVRSPHHENSVSKGMMIIA